MSFVHLHVHTEYSLLDGFSNIKKLVRRASEMDMPALAITDHGTMFGVIDFYNTAVKAGIKPIIGVESYLAARSMRSRDPQEDKKSTHLLLLAENAQGYQNLLNIASAAQLDGFYYYPRIDKELLAKYHEGLICTSGCMSAEVPRLLQQGRFEAAQQTLDWYYEVFGPERFFLELQVHDIPELATINKNLIDLGRRYQSRFVATNDVHYVDKEDARLQDVLLAIQTGSVLSDPNRMRMTDGSYYLRTPQEMALLFAEVPEAIANSVLIAERCNVDLGFKGYHLPDFSVPGNASAESYLRTLCEEGLQRRYEARSSDPVVRERLDYELRIIHAMGFDTYFLIVWDLCRYARERGIWYNARGSAAGSIVAYTLDITLVDPIQHGLIFERFLNPGRISMPDIDLDFRDDRRAEMLIYTAEKYGDDKVAQIITFGTLGARAAIRDVGRVMDIPLGEVDKIAKLIPNIPGKPVTIPQALEEVPEFKTEAESQPYLRELVDTAAKMEGVVRSAGTHAAGVIITDRPIIEYIPLHRPTGQSAEESPVKTVTQFEMSVLDSLGLLKVDFLGLATLTIMARACDLIRERHGITLNLDNIPTDDPMIYELMGRGETAGVFQVEGSGMRRWLMQMKPKELANVIAMVALFRPGPMDFIPGYIRRMHGEEEVSYRHPSLEPIFKETYGYPVYQEQLMFAVMQLAGYTPPEADDLRKAISKKIKEKLLKHREMFIAGAVKNEIAVDTASAIFDDWEEFARYGFNKAHAADYGVIAAQTAYLKAHYPVEYMTALLSVNLNDTAKVALYVADARRMGIGIEPPDVTISGWDFTIEDHENGKSTIRFGLGAVKNVGHGPVEAVLNARSEQPFQDLNNFAHRVDLRQVGKRALESLIKVGALDRFGPRVALLDGMDRMLAVSTSHHRASGMGQISLFGAHTGVTEQIVLPPAVSEVSRREILNWERELIGLYVSDHPLSPVMNELTQAVTHFSAQLSDAEAGERVRVAGLVTRIRHHNSKAGKPMGFITIEDLQGSIELVVFPSTWSKYSNLFEYDRILLVDGKTDLAGAEPKVLVDSITTDFKMVTSADAPPPSGQMVGNNSVRQKQRQPSQPAQAGKTATAPAPKTVSAVRPDAAIPNAESDINDQSADELKENTQTTPAADQLPVRSSEPVRVEELAAILYAEMPDGPDLFPEGWEATNIAGADLGLIAAAIFAVPAEDDDNHAAAGQTDTQPVSARTTPAVVAAAAQADTILHPEAAPRPDIASVLPHYFVSPATQPESSKVSMITVVMRATDDRMRDVLRMRRIHGTAMSYPGTDRFAFLVYERGRGYMVEFPNFTTGVCSELLSRLHLLVGQENVRVEPITFL